MSTLLKIPHRKLYLAGATLALTCLGFIGSARAANRPTPAKTHVVSVLGDEILLDGAPTKIKGLRTSNALMTDATTKELIDNLTPFQSYGMNTVSVFVM